jgi:hypothetical protein
VLDIGILLLGAPPFLILAGYCVLFYKKNTVTREEARDRHSSAAD